MRKIILLLVICVLFTNVAFAADVAYIVKNNANSNFVEAINEMGYSVDIIDDSKVASTNFSQYGMILVGKDKFSNPSQIPVNNYNSLIVNPYHYNTWGWSYQIGKKVASPILEIVNTAHIITEGLPPIMQVYTQYKVSNGVWYLKGQKYSGITEVSHNLIYPGEYVVAIKDRTPRSLFFGITESRYWTSNSEKLFKNSVEWVLHGNDIDSDGIYDDVDNCMNDYNPEQNDYDNDGVGDACDDPILLMNIPDITWNKGENSGITNLNNYFLDPTEGDLSFSIYDASTNDSIVIYGLDTGNVYFNTSDPTWCGDGWIVFNATNDKDRSVISNTVNLTVRCINGAPVIDEVNNTVVSVGDIARIVVIARDPEGNNLTYTINDARFNQTVENEFEWVTQIGDEGEHNFLVSVSDGSLTTSQEVNVSVISKVVINEFVSDPTDGIEWVEIYNPSGLDLSNCEIRDNTLSNKKTVNDSTGSTFVVVEWSSSMLNNGGDVIKLVCDNIILDEVHYGSEGGVSAPINGQSAGRVPDGYDTNNDATDFVIFDYPTKGFSNSEDVVPSVVTLISPMNDGVTGGNVIFEYNVSDDKAIVLQCSLYTNTNGSWLLEDTHPVDNGDSDNFTLSGIQPGTYIWNVKCNDGRNSAFASINWTFNVVNNVPVFNGALTLIEWNEDESNTTNLDNYFSDADGDVLSYEVISVSDSNIKWNIANNILTLSSAENWNGEGWIILRASDKWGGIVDSNITVKVFAVNDAPILDSVNDVVINENESVTITLNGVDVDGDSLTYDINDTKFNKTSDNTFVWQTDYNSEGAHEFLASVSDGNLSDSKGFRITIENVNQLPVLNPILDQYADEDDPYKDDIHLNFSDADGVVVSTEISYENIDEVDCQISNGDLAFTPAHNFYGNATCTVKVIDNEGAFDEESVLIYVSGINDAPIIKSYSPTTNLVIITEDASQTFDVEWEDIDSLDSQIKRKWYVDDVEVGMGNSYTFTATGNNTHMVRFSVNDSEYTVSQEWNLFATDLPIHNFSLFNLTGTLDDVSCLIMGNNYGKIEFCPTSLDLSDTADLVNNVVISNGFVSLNIDALPVFNDKEAKVVMYNQTENVVYYNPDFKTNRNGVTSVCPSNICSNIQLENNSLSFNIPHFSSFASGPMQTCSQLGGDVCSSNQVCNGDILTSSDDMCCSITCIEAPFDTNNSDVDKCENGIVGNLKIDIKEPDKGDDFKIGDTIPIEVKVKNGNNEDVDVEVESTLFNVDENDEIVSVRSDEVEIGEGDSETFELELKVPNDKEVDDSDEFVLFVKAYGDDEEEQCNENSIKVDIEREEHSVVITKMILMPSSVECNDFVNVEVEIENQGKKQEDAYVELQVLELGVLQKSDVYELEKYNKKNNDAVIRLSFNIKNNVKEGDYDVKATVYFNDESNSDTESLHVGKCVEQPIVTRPVTQSSNVVISPGTVVPVFPTITYPVTSPVISPVQSNYLFQVGSGQAIQPVVSGQTVQPVNVQSVKPVAGNYEFKVLQTFRDITKKPTEKCDGWWNGFSNCSTLLFILVDVILLFLIVMALAKLSRRRRIRK